jgi:hypothetical protein
MIRAAIVGIGRYGRTLVGALQRSLCAAFL